MKVTPALLLPYFLLQRRWNWPHLARAGIGLLALAGSLPGLQGTVDAHRSWIDRAVRLRGTHASATKSSRRWSSGSAREANLRQAGIDPIVPLDGATADRIGKLLSWGLIPALRLRCAACLQCRRRSAPGGVGCWRCPTAGVLQLIALFPLPVLSLWKLARRPGCWTWSSVCPSSSAWWTRSGTHRPARFELLDGAGLTCAPRCSGAERARPVASCKLEARSARTPSGWKRRESR